MIPLPSQKIRQLPPTAKPFASAESDRFSFDHSGSFTTFNSLKPFLLEAVFFAGTALGIRRESAGSRTPAAEI